MSEKQKDIGIYPTLLEIEGDICHGGPCLSRKNPNLCYTDVRGIDLRIKIHNEDLYKENIYQALNELFQKVLEYYR